jgi:endonuclease YncB( thermonuclease family)
LRNQLLIGICVALLSANAAAEGTFFKNRKTAEPAPQTQTQQAQPTQSTPQPQPASQTQEQQPNVSGRVDRVVTTDTFVVNGQQIMLFGVVGEPTPYAEALAQWLVSNGNQMNCEPEGGRYRCTTPGGVDVAGVVIFNGAGKASADAPQEYQDAEAQARNGRKGVWQ